MREKELWREYLRQTNCRTLDVSELSFSIIEEAASNDVLSDKSIEALLSILREPDVQRDPALHSITSALWSDGQILSPSQLDLLREFLIGPEMPNLKHENSYSICDMVAEIFDMSTARSLLAELQKRTEFRDAASYMMDDLNRRS